MKMTWPSRTTATAAPGNCPTAADRKISSTLLSASGKAAKHNDTAAARSTAPRANITTPGYTIYPGFVFRRRLREFRLQHGVRMRWKLVLQPLPCCRRRPLHCLHTLGAEIVLRFDVRTVDLGN